jgi:hypothetical protein
MRRYLKTLEFREALSERVEWIKGRRGRDEERRLVLGYDVGEAREARKPKRARGPGLE